MLVAGEAGVGKTRLVEDAVDPDSFHFLRGLAQPGGSRLRAGGRQPCAAICGWRRRASARAGPCGPTSRCCSRSSERPSARATGRRSSRPSAAGFAAIAADRPTVVLLDDLQSSDATTLELLAYLAPSLPELPLVVIGAYRSDEVPRSHPLRRLRNELRRSGLLREIALEPLSESGTADLAGQVLGEPPSPRLARTLHDRTAGVPFFVEELACALEADGRLRPATTGSCSLSTTRSRCLRRSATPSCCGQPTSPMPRGRVPRPPPWPAPVSRPTSLRPLAARERSTRSLATGLMIEREPGRAEFRHPLARDAIYEDIPWLRRRSLHRELAAAIESRGGSRAEVAAHRLAARDTAPRIDAMVEAVDELAAVHAYRDAARVGRQALSLWPEGERGIRAHRAPREVRAGCEPRRRARRGGPRPARGRRRAAHRGGRPGTGRRRAQPRRDLRAPGRPRPRAHRPLRRRRRLRRQRPSRGGRRRATDRRGLPAERRQARGGHRADAQRGRGGGARRADRPARPRPRTRRGRHGQGR